jgi:hypothetical protein
MGRSGKIFFIFCALSFFSSRAHAKLECLDVHAIAATFLHYSYSFSEVNEELAKRIVQEFRAELKPNFDISKLSAYNQAFVDRSLQIFSASIRYHRDCAELEEISAVMDHALQTEALYPIYLKSFAKALDPHSSFEQIVEAPANISATVSPKSPMGEVAKLEIHRDNKDRLIGFLKLTSFEESKDANLPEVFSELLQQANANAVRGLVIDLRNNRGGSVEFARRLAGMFFETAVLHRMYDRDDNATYDADLDGEILFQEPVVILVNEMTASAAEMFAGDLGDYGRAMIIGSDHTFGKGTAFVALQNDQTSSKIRVTHYMFTTPSGRSPQGVGILSDIVLRPADPLRFYGESDLRYSIPTVRKDPMITPESGADCSWKRLTSTTISNVTSEFYKASRASHEMSEENSAELALSLLIDELDSSDR